MIKTESDNKPAQWKSLSAMKLRKEGVLTALTAIEDIISLIEIMEKNASRRYKLLKHIILSSKTNLNHIVDYGEIKGFSYKFRDGELCVKESKK